MKKRVLSCLMALALCLTLLPAAAASAYYDDYHDGYYGSGHTHYLCGAGSSSDDYAPGSGSCTCWGCDITYDYIKINGDYRT